MKKLFIVTAILAAMLVVIGCAPKEIPPAAITEIYAMSDADDITDYVEVKDVSDRGDYCYVMIYIKSPSGEFTTLEEAIPKATTYAMNFTEAAVAILDRYDIDKKLSVWAQLPLKEGGVTIIGHAEYDGKRILDFEKYEYAE